MKKIFIALCIHLDNLKTKTKLIIVYLIAGIIPIIILGSISICTNNINMMQFEKTQLSAENDRVRNILFNLTYLSSNISQTICTDPTLISILSTQYDSADEVYETYRNYSLLDSYTGNYTEISNIKLYVSNKSLINSGHFIKITPDIEQTSWYKAAEESSGEVVWIFDSSLNSYTSIHLIRVINIPQNNTHAVLVISISNNYLRSMLEGSNYHSMFSLNNKQVVYSKKLQEQGTSLPFELSNRIRSSQVYSTKYRGNTVLAYDTSLNALYSNDQFQIITISDCLQNIRKTIFVFIFILIIAIIIPLILIILFSNIYSKRVNTVREEMHKVSLGNFEINSSFRGNDELGELFHDMNATIQAIKGLNEEIYKEKLMKKELENQQQRIQFELLASQINPHFLFNTLESIRMQAAINGQEEITFIIMELGKLLRFSLDNKNEPVALSHELEYLKAYFEIQHFRYQNKINYKIHISPKLDVTSVHVLPLILQPIVENAFTHGFSTKKVGGLIDINILERDDNILITIHDNGVGMTQAELILINNSLKNITLTHSRSIGMRNVHNRIQLFYGKDYGLTVVSEKKVGTTVTIKIPFRKDFYDESAIY